MTIDAAFYAANTLTVALFEFANRPDLTEGERRAAGIAHRIMQDVESDLNARALDESGRLPPPLPGAAANGPTPTE